MILKEMGRPVNKPIDTVSRNWGAVCNFLYQWAGNVEKQKQAQEPTLTKEQKLIMQGKVCPYCKKPSEYLKDSTPLYKKDYGPIYICWGCSAWVGCHRPEPKKALGRLATKELREWKSAAHAAFDPIFKSNLKSRHDAYTWLSEQLGIPRAYTHIGMFGLETCKKVVEICNLELK